MADKNLENRIAALEKWQDERKKQQIVFPLDFQSQKILANYFMQIVGEITTTEGAGGNEFTLYLGKQGLLNFNVSKNTYVVYTVNATSNVFTTVGVNFMDDAQLFVATSGTVPTPLALATGYYVINSAGQTFQLSATLGGAAINITNTGTGTQYIYYQ